MTQGSREAPSFEGIRMKDEDLSRPHVRPPVVRGGRRSRQPVFNLPGVVTLSLMVLIVIFALQNVLTDEQLNSFYLTFGFIPARYATPLEGQGLVWLWTPVTYSLLHGSIEHILFNGLWLMAFGAPVARRIGTSRYLVFWILSSVASAFLHAALNWGAETLLIGASGVISGLMGAACRFAFPPRGGSPFGRPAHLNPRLSMIEALRSRTVLIFVVFWFVGNLLIAAGLSFIDTSQPIAWDAHIGGFLFGFVLFGFFDKALPKEPEHDEEEEPLP